MVKLEGGRVEQIVQGEQSPLLGQLEDLGGVELHCIGWVPRRHSSQNALLNGVLRQVRPLYGYTKLLAGSLYYRPKEIIERWS